MKVGFNLIVALNLFRESTGGVRTREFVKEISAVTLNKEESSYYTEHYLALISDVEVKDIELTTIEKNATEILYGDVDDSVKRIFTQCLNGTTHGIIMNRIIEGNPGLANKH